MTSVKPCARIPLREKLFFRMIDETTTRPREVLESRIELWNRTTGEITFPRTRAGTNAGPGATCAPRTMKLTGNTSEMLRHYVGNRKKGHIFINSGTGKRLTLRYFEKMIDTWIAEYPETAVHQVQREGVQLSRLWKEVLGSKDAGDFRTFMKEVADLTHDEARRKLLKTYGTPERIHIKSVKDVEEVFHAQMCEAAEEQCGKAILKPAGRPVRIAGSGRSVCSCRGKACGHMAQFP